MSIKEIFEKRKDDPMWNTSYPLSPEDWTKYRVDAQLSFEGEDELSFYIHIPFCKKLCSFCEYTRMICPDENVQNHYLDVVSHDIAQFKSKYKDYVLKGFDIGGGTPTSLTDSCFSKLLDVYDGAIEGLKISYDYEPSIEGTFNTLSERKLDRIARSGIKRLSLGIQTTNGHILYSHNREEIENEAMHMWMNKAYEYGIKKINLDLMYGLIGQNEESIRRDLEIIRSLAPQQVTLYELRTNMISCKKLPAKIELYGMYSQLYEGLKSMGYNARFGQNTFSIDDNDSGVSSYLRSRMIDGASYKGFGISAQSMNSKGVSYNYGKNYRNIFDVISRESYEEEYTYNLPSAELNAKYIAISGYYGSFSLSRVLSRENNLNEVIAFCKDNGLVELKDNRIQITEKGFMYYGAVLSLFIISPRII